MSKLIDMLRKTAEADKAKEVYSLAVKLREKHKNELSKFSNPGPGGSDLDEDEYDEYKKITDKLKEETRDSFFCKKAIAFDIKGTVLDALGLTSII